MLGINKLREALSSALKQVGEDGKEVYWMVPPQAAQRPMILWARLDGTDIVGHRLDGVRPLVRITMVGRRNAAYEDMETLREAVIFHLSRRKVISNHPGDPSDSYPDTTREPQVQILVQLQEI